jgi:glycerol-3-phosphate acyltransferase PlsY
VPFAVVLILSYLLGSAPFGLLLGFMAGKDVRRHGSNNIGATNVWRVCGWKWGIAAFILDFLKGLLAVQLVARASAGRPGAPYPALGCALCAVLGHNFPAWIGFRGGKGVATSAGAMAGLLWPPFLAALAVFILTVRLSHYISLGSMTASVALVIAGLLYLPEPFGRDLPLTVTLAALCALLTCRHRKNIGRILAGTENRFPPPKTARETPEP